MSSRDGGRSLRGEAPGPSHLRPGSMAGSPPQISDYLQEGSSFNCVMPPLSTDTGGEEGSAPPTQRLRDPDSQKNKLRTITTHSGMEDRALTQVTNE